MEDKIKVIRARENNLKNLSVEIPKNKLVVFTGLSGSGKTALAFDTIYQEGQRRYVESLSSYARQFLGNLEKPDVDAIEGLSPAIAIDQKTTSHNPRSTVGTVTEIYDYLRLLYARIGTPYCPIHHKPIISFSVSMMVDQVMKFEEGTKVQIISPVVTREKGTHAETLEKIRAQGFIRLRVDGNFMLIDEVPLLDKNINHSIDIVIDRLVIKDGIRSRLFDAIELALDWSHGYLIIYDGEKDTLLSMHHTCDECGFSVPKLEPRLFSFNSPIGYCPDCHGLGVKREADVNLLVPNQKLSIKQGAIEYFKNTVNTTNLEWQEFKVLLDYYNIPIDVPFETLTNKQKDIIFNGSPKIITYSLTSVSKNVTHRKKRIEGVKTKVERLYEETTSSFMREYYEKFLHDIPCSTCHGARLNEQALAVLIDGKNIYEATKLNTYELKCWMERLREILSPEKKQIGELVINEIHTRAAFLNDVGLDYLTLDRMSMTLSGGESQRIRLATQIGSTLSGVIYVLDEPSIGLHQKDNGKLIDTLRKMRDLGNSLIVVEHDEETMRAADFIVDIGPGAGVHGGEVVVAGTVDDVMNEPRSITGRYLSGKEKIEIPSERTKGNGRFLTLRGASLNNLKDVDVSFPLGTLIAVTGVSGSGKSSLIIDTLYKAIASHLEKVNLHPGPFSSLDGLKFVDKIVDVTQDPIGRTPRSNPATYTKVFDRIRDLYAETLEAKARGFGKGRFSFNIPGGRCENCQGAGVTRIPMNFLPDVYVKCEKCEGKRYNEETLLCVYKNKTISDVLDMTIEEAYEFFKNLPKIASGLKMMMDVGLGYMKLGQPATTLSGGEAQRVKLANELQRKPTGKTIYLLDEPTTGLHTDDVKRLLKVLRRIVDHGDTVIVIEHNLDVIKVSDYIIDLGPDGGDKGGEVIAVGTPEEVAKNPRSYTGQYLKRILFD